MFDKEDRKNLARGMSLLSQLGVTALVCVALGVFIGFWGDRFFDTSPVLLIIFSILGVASALHSMIKIAKKM